MENENNAPQQDNSRSSFVIILLITSLIAVGLTSVYDLMLLVIKSASPDVIAEAMEQSMEQVRQMGIGNPAEVDMTQMQRLIDNCGYHLLFNIIEFVAIVMLFLRKPQGIHFYLASQIGLAYVAYMTMGAASFLVILTCVLWSLLYWKAYLQMFGDRSAD